RLVPPSSPFSNKTFTTKDTKVHKGQTALSFVYLCVLCGLCACYLFAHSNPGLQFAGGAEEADARPFQFEIRVLQRVVTLVGLIAGIVQIVQSRASRIDSGLHGLEVGLGDLALQVDDLLQGGELRDRTLQ